MKLKQNIFRFMLFTLLLCCVFSTAVEAQRRTTASPQCTPGSWVERSIKLGQPLPTFSLLGGDIEVQITDNNGNVDSIGGNIKIINNTADEIEYQPDNTNSIWYPIPAGESVMEGIPQYRNTNDKSPTVYSVKVRYKCGTQSSGRNRQNNQTNNQSQQNQNNSQKSSNNQSRGANSKAASDVCEGKYEEQKKWILTERLKGSNVDDPSVVDKNYNLPKNWTLLMHFAHQNEPCRVKILLDMGANPNHNSGPTAEGEISWCPMKSAMVNLQNFDDSMPLAKRNAQIVNDLLKAAGGKMVCK